MSDYIFEDNLRLIFKYLPAKSLLRFRCVCKGLKQLVDSHSFVQEHLSVQKPCFFVEYGRKYTVVDPRTRPLVHTLSKPIENKDFRLFGTLHGVVCLYQKHILDNGVLVLWNPTIRKYSILTLPSVFHVRDCYWPSLHTCYGFWIDPLSKEFKIIILSRQSAEDFFAHLSTPQDWRCILYSSIRQKWSAVPVGKLKNWNSCETCPPVMIGGVAYWGGCLGGGYLDVHSDHDHDYKVILSFDFLQESFDVIEMPDLSSCDTKPFRWQGRLALVCWDQQWPCECEIYLRQENSWVKMVKFEVFESFIHVFWAMEDIDDRQRRGKRKREERIGNVLAEPKENVRVFGSNFFDEITTARRELIFYGTKTGRATVKRDLKNIHNVKMAYDFVESLLFP